MFSRVAAAALMVATGLVVVLPADQGQAQFFPRREASPPARSQPQRRGFLELLFGPLIRQPPSRQQPRQPLGPSVPAVPTVEVQPKDPDARKILVIGDFVARGLAWGLEQTFANELRLVVIDRSNGSSGLVRDDFYDWNKELPGILNADRPDVVVMMIGSNDRQAVRNGAERLQPRTEAWEKTYIARIEGITDTLKLYGQPFFWVGAPPMSSDSASRDMAYLNELYRPRVTADGGYFIDIWTGFTNENGRYVSSGPDAEGQLRALRTSDGVNFTRAGRLKLAFYVEREMRHRTGLGTGTVDLIASVTEASQIEIGPDGKKRMVGPVISLSAPRPGASAALAGESEPPGDRLVSGDRVTPPLLSTPEDAESPQYLMIIKGEGLPSVAGRADDFTWPPRRQPIIVQPETTGAVTGDAAPVMPLPALAPRAVAN